MPETFMSLLESVAAEVADWGLDIIKSTVEAVAPDGRPFDRELLSPEEQLNEYLNIRGSEASWNEWINLQELQILQNLVAAQLPEDEIALINPRGLAIAYAMKYSADMEKLLVNRMNDGNSNDD